MSSPQELSKYEELIRYKEVSETGTKIRSHNSMEFRSGGSGVPLTCDPFYSNSIQGAGGDENSNSKLKALEKTHTIDSYAFG